VRGKKLKFALGRATKAQRGSKGMAMRISDEGPAIFTGYEVMQSKGSV